MLSNEYLLAAINTALNEVENLPKRFKSFNVNEEPLQSVLKVLCNLKTQLLENNGQFSINILRAMHDIGVASFRAFENTSLETALDRVIEILYNDIEVFKDLHPLRKKFDFFVSQLPLSCP
jgi:hypothetical protein